MHGAKVKKGENKLKIVIIITTIFSISGKTLCNSPTRVGFIFMTVSAQVQTMA
jgi:hypothetical protein